MGVVLLVEDDIALLQVLKSAMEESGHHVLEAFDGLSALKIVKSISVDLMITDIFLPEKDGLELIRETKISSPDVKIIAISGGGKLDEFIYLKAAMVLGADCKFEKPFQINELLDSIEELMGVS